jgi:hypothetical protein
MGSRARENSKSSTLAAGVQILPLSPVVTLVSERPPKEYLEIKDIKNRKTGIYLFLKSCFIF